MNLTNRRLPPADESVVALRVNTMRALIAAAGTGGHIYPGIAVAKEILRRNPESEIRFVWNCPGLEGKLVPKAGFELSIIESAGLKSVGSIARLRGAAMLPRSFMAARRIIRTFVPMWSSARVVTFQVQ